MVRTVRFIERRRHPRVCVSEDSAAPAVLARGRDLSSLSNVRVRDLSAGGLAVEGPVRLTIAEPVTVNLSPESPGALGRVVRCRRCGGGYRIAVAFAPSPTCAG